MVTYIMESLLLGLSELRQEKVAEACFRVTKFLESRDELLVTEILNELATTPCFKD